MYKTVLSLGRNEILSLQVNKIVQSRTETKESKYYLACSWGKSEVQYSSEISWKKEKNRYGVSLIVRSQKDRINLEPQCRRFFE